MRITLIAPALTIMIMGIGTMAPQAPISQDSAEQSVRNMFAHPGGGYAGWDVKSLSPLGDAAAVAITKVLGGNGVSPGQVSQVLLILTLSFQSPKGIANATDRDPRTTLFLLRYLESSTKDPALLAKIAETRSEILQNVQHAK